MDHKLTPEETEERAIELAETIEEYKHVKRAQKDAAKEFTLTLDELDKKIVRLARTVRTGLEDRDAQLSFPGIKSGKAKGGRT